MIDAKKVSKMARLAIYEQGEGKEDEKIRRYSRRVYMDMHRLIDFLAISAAYILAAGLYCFRYVDDIFSQGFGYDYKPLIMHLLFVYVIALAAGLFFTDRIHKKRYDRMIDNLKRYDFELYHLEKYIDDNETD